MRIMFGGLTLCEGENDSPFDMRMDGQKAIQSEPVFRGQFPETNDRGNQTRTISFGLIKEHDSIAEAETYFLMHSEDIPAGTHTLILESDDRCASLYFRGFLNAFGSSYDGASTTHQYTFIGTKIDRLNPN